MRKFLLFIVCIVVAAIAAFYFLPSLFSINSYKGTIERLVSDHTGRKFTINGPIHLTILPKLGVSLEDIAMANPPGFNAPAFFTVKKVGVRADISALLGGNIQVEEISFEHPVILLEKRQDGVANWVITPPKSAAAAPEKAAPAKSDEEAEKKPSSINLTFSNFRIKNGEISYKEGRKRYIAEAVNGNITLPKGNTPFVPELAFRYQNAPYHVKFSLDRPESFATGKASPFALDAALAELPITAKGNVAYSAKIIQLSGLSVTVKNQPAQGNLHISLAGERPCVTGDIAFEKLDVDSFIASLSTPKTEAVADKSSEKAAQAAPFSLAFLDSFIADLRLKAGTLIIAPVTLQNVDAHVTVRNKTATLVAKPFGIYGGTAEGTAVVENAPGAPKLALTLAAREINMQQLLQGLGATNRLKGLVEVNSQLTATGLTKEAVLSSLGGKGNIAISEGSIAGVDINIAPQQLISALNREEKTSNSLIFKSITGSFSIQKGVLTNPDGLLVSDIATVHGNGTVNLPQHSLNYRVETDRRFKELGNIPLAVLIDGDLSHPRYRFDAASLLQHAPRSREELNNQLKALKEDGKDLRKNLGKNLEGILRGLQ